MLSCSARARLAGSAFTGLLVCVVSVGTPRVARAQSRAGDVAAAQALFEEARGLVKAGKAAEACPKFEESERLDAGPGTEFNLADCYERAGRTASAWAEFALVADSLRALGQHDRERLARDRAGALEPKLSRLTVNVAPAVRVAGLEIKRDGEVVRDAQWGSGVPLDPGPHVVAASAPGKQPWQQTVDVEGQGKTVTLEVPPLVDQPAAPIPAAPAAAPSPASPPPAAPSTEDSSAGGLGTGRILALVVGGVGVVGLGVGTYFGTQAISNHNNYTSLCPAGRCTSESAVQTHDTAASDATISTVAIAAGAAAVAGGVVIWLLSPPKRDPARVGLRAVPSFGPQGGGLSLQGAW